MDSKQPVACKKAAGFFLSWYFVLLYSDIFAKIEKHFVYLVLKRLDELKDSKAFCRIKRQTKIMIDRRQYNNQTDEQLVQLTLAEPENFAYLIDRYQGKLANYIRKITSLSPEGVEDVLQDVFIKIYRNLNSFDQDLKFSSWAYRIAHNQVISDHRKIKARPQTVTLEVEDDFLANLASDLDARQDLDLSYLRENIKKVLDSMDLKYKEVLVLKFLEDKDYQEISDILQKPVGTVGTLISRAKKQFKKKVQEANIKF